MLSLHGRGHFDVSDTMLCTSAPLRCVPLLVLAASMAALTGTSGCTTTVTTTKGPTTSGKATAVPKAKKPEPPTAEETAAAATVAAIQQVTATEQAFAKSMADRNFQAFASFLSPEAVFFSGSQVHRGGDAVAEAWQPYFVGPKAPFSWRPDHVEVLASGKLALSTGPVYEGPNVVGRFNSIWRLESPGTWRIVFDKGEAVCNILPAAP
jgi:ketosteroid isomerase-like protein